MVSIFAKLESVGVMRRFIFNFFANQSFSRHRKTELLRKWIALELQVKFRFMSCLEKAKDSVAVNIKVKIVLVFTKQPFAERYLANIFLPVFCELLENSSSASKCIPKSFRKFAKKHQWRSLMLVKLQGFTGITTGCIL